MFEDPLRAAAAQAIRESMENPVRLAIETGLGVGEVIEILKKQFVTETIQMRLEKGASRPTSTELSKRTGLERGLAARLERGEELRPLSGLNPGVMLMNAWRSLPDYLEGGQPKIIPIRGEAPSFHALAIATTGKGLRPTSLLKLLQDQNVVKTVSKGHVQLVSDTYGGTSLTVDEIKQAGRSHGYLGRTLIQKRANSRDPHVVCFLSESRPLDSERGAVLTDQLLRGLTLGADSHDRAAALEADQSKHSSSRKERVVWGFYVQRVPLTKGDDSLRRNSQKKDLKKKSLTQATTGKKKQ